MDKSKIEGLTSEEELALSLKDKKDEEKSTIKTLKELKLAFTEFYLALVLIQNYQVIFK